MDDTKKNAFRSADTGEARTFRLSRVHSHNHHHPHHTSRPLLTAPSTSHRRRPIEWAVKAKHIGRKRTLTRRTKKKKNARKNVHLRWIHTYAYHINYSMRIESYIGLVSSTREIDAEWARSAYEFTVDSDAHSGWPYGCTTGHCEPHVEHSTRNIQRKTPCRCFRRWCFHLSKLFM